MTTKLNPYLSFKDNAREAMTFYQGVFGGTLNAQTFKELNGAQNPSEENLVMHSQLETESGLTIMASDTPDRMEFKPGTNFSMSLSGGAADEDELRRYFNGLADGGTVTMPLEKAIWDDTFGMCIDRFGITWLVNISGSS